MKKKDFIELADMIRNHNTKLVEFRNQKQNPQFDRQLWLNYIEGNCGPSGGKI